MIIEKSAQSMIRGPMYSSCIARFDLRGLTVQVSDWSTVRGRKRGKVVRSRKQLHESKSISNNV